MFPDNSTPHSLWQNYSRVASGVGRISLLAVFMLAVACGDQESGLKAIEGRVIGSGMDELTGFWQTCGSRDWRVWTGAGGRIASFLSLVVREEQVPTAIAVQSCQG